VTVRKALTAALVLLALLIVALDAAGARYGKRQLWGAIAYSSKTGSYGYAVDLKTKRDAETEAFRQCGSNCDLIRTFRDACGAVAAKPNRVSSDTGASREIAEMKALKKCGSDCAVKVWACTSEK
jgi:serine/threonine-protein kinase